MYKYFVDHVCITSALLCIYEVNLNHLQPGMKFGGKRDFKFGGKFQIQKFETDFQRRLITSSLKIHFQRRLYCHNRPWKNIFRDGCIAAAAPCNSFSGRFMYWNRRWKRIFRGGLPTATAPENAFSDAVLLLEPPHFQGRRSQQNRP